MRLSQRNGSTERESVLAHMISHEMLSPPANRAGGQFTFEQQVNKRLTLAAEWYTGKQAVGYVNPGAIIKLTSKLTLYTAYQIGNSGVTAGNHQFLWEFGYNFN